MRDLMPPEPMLRDAPRRNRPIAGTVAASLMLHAGLLALLLLPQRDALEAAPPPAIDVELVPPPEASSAAPQTDEQSPEEPQSSNASASPEAATAESAAEAAPPAEPSATEPPSEQPDDASDEASSPEEGSETEASRAAAKAPSPAAPTSDDTTDTAPEPPAGAEATGAVAPVPLSRPSVRGLTAPSSEAEDGVAALTDGGELTDGVAAAAASVEPDVATLELGPLRSAGRFYLEDMLGSPGMERARDMLPTLPPDKRLAQTCNIEALAQIGYAGDGFAPDVVMAEAYARSEVTGTQLSATGAIFRSEDKWYGFAFECTLNAELTRVTAFSYRLGADVTDAVLARLSEN